jgi:biotin carboxylase
MSDTLLVLAASTYQIPVIEAARRMGYRVITSDNTPSNPGHRLADASFTVDTTDVAGCIDLARRQRISGVIAPATDVAVLTAACIAEHLRLPGPSVAAAIATTHKLRFREFLTGSGFCSPRAIDVTNGLTEGIDFDGKAWLLKPCRSSGSKGVFIVRTASEFHGRIEETRSFSLDGQALLEEFVSGTQHTCEGAITEGRIAMSLITDRDTTPAPHTATSGHRVPTRLSPAMQQRALQVIERALRHLEIEEGPFDCDFVATPADIVLIEITPRIGGNSLMQLVEKSVGFDLTGYAVRYAGGQKPLPFRTHDPLPMAVAILGVHTAGRLFWDVAAERELRAAPWVESLVLDYRQGTSVQAFVNGRHRVGEAVVRGVDRDQLDTHLDQLERRLALAAA